MKYIEESENSIVYRVEEDGLKVKEILLNKLNISGRFLRRLEENQAILLNKKRVKTRKLTKAGDIINVMMDDEAEPNIPKQIPIDIIYEDFDLIILNKQPNIVVHPTKSHVDNTIVNGLANYFMENNINKKVRLVNRLDMNTSGVLVVAKNSFGHQQLAKQFENDTIEKTYLAVVEGVMQNDEGILDMPIGEDVENPIKNIVREDGKKAITIYRVIERYSNASLVELSIKTGRTHQIRVHLKHIGHPIIGDTLYNKPSELINRQSLHSYSLKFRTPRKNEEIAVKAEMPMDMKELIDLLK